MIERCLENLLPQIKKLGEIIVIDTSTTNKTQDIIVKKYPGVKYFLLSNGKNMRPASKNIGIKYSESEIIAFIDDDSIVQQGWLTSCLSSYISNDVGGIGGRIIDVNSEGESYFSNDIGKVTINGIRIGNFHKDPGKIIEVDHIRGCNMSFRKSVLAKVEGFDINYIGSNVLEETDLCIRIKKKGYKILFDPNMCVVHTAAPREQIYRELFTLRREYYIARNSTYFMLKNFNIFQTILYILSNNSGICAFIHKPRLRSFLCIFMSFFGKIMGILAFLRVKLIKLTSHYKKIYIK